MYISKINFVRLLVLAALASILAQAIHETGHMLIYQMYQREPTWGFIGLVQIWDRKPVDSNHWVQLSAPDGSIGWLRLGSSPDSKTEKMLEAAAGPFASLISTILGLWITYKTRHVVHKLVGLMLALITSFSMTAYYLRSPLRMIGDEFDVASQLNISKGIVEIIFGIAFLLYFMLSLRQFDTWSIRLKWLLSVILGSITTGILLNIADPWVRELVNQNSLFFQPFMGYSLPVFLVYLLVVVGIFVWGSKTQETISSEMRTTD